MNPFEKEDCAIIEKIDGEIIKRTSKSFNERSFWNYIPIYIKYKNQVSNSYFFFRVFDILYEEETKIFTETLFEICSYTGFKNILDFGCGTCKIWRDNKDLIKDKSITCIDLDKDILQYPAYLLNDCENINIKNISLFDLKLEEKLDVALFIEVIMQLPEPHKFFEYIWKHNPECKIVMAHTVFFSFVNIINFFKTKIVKYIPILSLTQGEAMTISKTKDIVHMAGGRITSMEYIYNNKVVFIAEKN